MPNLLIVLLITLLSSCSSLKAPFECPEGSDLVHTEIERHSLSVFKCEKEFEGRKVRDGNFVLMNLNASKLFEGSYSLDKPNGKFVRSTRNGQKIMEYEFKEGKINGPFKLYSQTSQLISHGTIHSDEEMKLTIHWADRRDKKGIYKRLLMLPGLNQGIYRKILKNCLMVAENQDCELNPMSPEYGNEAENPLLNLYFILSDPMIEELIKS